MMEIAFLIKFVKDLCFDKIKFNLWPLRMLPLVMLRMALLIMLRFNYYLEYSLSCWREFSCEAYAQEVGL